MNKNGQTAFETLVLFVVVASVAIVTLSLYTSINDDTTAMQIARAQTNKQLAIINENIQISKIELSKTSTNTTVKILLTQNTTLDTTAIKEAILAKTTIKNLTITVQ